MVKKIVLWLSVIGCMTVIFMFSHQSAEVSHDLSSSFLFRILSFFDAFDKMSRSAMTETVEFLHFLIRKGAHFSVYALLGFLTYLLVRTGYGIKGRMSMLIPSVTGLLYAATDEIHQFFIPGRSGQLTDVLLDTSGAIAGTLAALLICTLLARRKKNG